MFAVAAGPAMAILHESGTFSLGPPATLWPIGFIVVVAAAGVATGLRVAHQTSRGWGALVVAPNLLVLLFYGFLLLFFGSGWSR
jgi:apolipoprotein N-acyltransferase